MIRILITGEQGVGKSTLTQNLVQKLHLKPSGFKTLPIYEGRQKLGYYLQDLETGEKYLFAHRRFKSDKRLGDFGIREEVFEKFGTQIVAQVMSKEGWIVIDEVGIMESDSRPFVDALKKLWKSPRNQIWVIQKRSPILGMLVNLRVPYHLFDVTVSNRGELANEILKTIRHTANNEEG
ncbi:MAG: hypothetical protein GXO76_12495 [Calditrichaeota bacterium]|nr:hypothetical protein [Calditrichota bacterium]